MGILAAALPHGIQQATLAASICAAAACPLQANALLPSLLDQEKANVVARLAADLELTAGRQQCRADRKAHHQEPEQKEDQVAEASDPTSSHNPDRLQ